MTTSDETPRRSADGSGGPNAAHDPGDLIEAFNDYLDRGEHPPRELLDGSPDHRLTLDALVRFRRVTSVVSFAQPATRCREP
jgi:hypothetical protein